MSYLTQMLALTVQNFVSAAAGMSVLVALVRGLAQRVTARFSPPTTHLGDAWTFDSLEARPVHESICWDTG